MCCIFTDHCFKHEATIFVLVPTQYDKINNIICWYFVAIELYNDIKQYIFIHKRETNHKNTNYILCFTSDLSHE